MAEQITIAGSVFNVPVRYEEGHELTANEAAALNQTFHENLRNNFAKRVDSRKENGELDSDVKEELQSELDSYADEYEFGGPRGGAVRDPVMSEAMKMAAKPDQKVVIRHGVLGAFFLKTPDGVVVRVHRVK